MVIAVSPYVADIKENHPRSTETYNQLMDKFIKDSSYSIYTETIPPYMDLNLVPHYKKALDNIFSTASVDFPSELRAYLACVQFHAEQFLAKTRERNSIWNLESSLEPFKRQLHLINKQFNMDVLVEVNSIEAKALGLALGYFSDTYRIAISASNGSN